MPLDPERYSLSLKQVDTLTPDDIFWLRNLQKSAKIYHPNFLNNINPLNTLIFICYESEIIVGAGYFQTTDPIINSYDGLLSIITLSSHKTTHNFTELFLDEFLKKLIEYHENDEVIEDLFISYNIAIPDHSYLMRYENVFRKNGFTVKEQSKYKPIAAFQVPEKPFQLVSSFYKDAKVARIDLLRSLKSTSKKYNGNVKKDLDSLFKIIYDLDVDSFANTWKTDSWRNRGLNKNQTFMVNNFLSTGRLSPDKFYKPFTINSFTSVELLKLVNYLTKSFGVKNSVLDKKFYRQSKIDTLKIYLSHSNIVKVISILKSLKKINIISQETTTKKSLNLLITSTLLKPTLQRKFPSPISVELCLYPRKLFGLFALQQTSSSKFIKVLNKKILSSKMKITSSGLKTNSGVESLPTIKDVFSLLDLKYVPIQERLKFKEDNLKSADEEEQDYPLISYPLIDLQSRFYKIVKVEDRPQTDIYINPSLSEIRRIETESPSKEVWFIAEGRNKILYAWSGGTVSPDRIWRYLKSKRLLEHDPTILIGISKKLLITFTNIDEIRKYKTFKSIFLKIDWSFMNKFFKFNQYKQEIGSDFDIKK